MTPETERTDQAWSREDRIRADLLPRLRAKVDALTERAQKKGLVGGFTLEVLEYEVVKERPDWSPTPIEVVYVLVRITGESPRTEKGWAWVGTVEHTGSPAGNLLHGNISEDYRHAAPVCGHCGLDRDRQVTLVVRDEAGAEEQIGKACAKDVLGWHPEPRVFEDALREVEEVLYEGGGNRGQDYPTVWVLSIALASIRANGWVSKGKALDDPRLYATAEVVRSLTFGPRPSDRHPHLLECWERARQAHRGPEDLVDADRLLAWVEELDPEGSQYLGNLKVTLSKTHLVASDLGLAVSAWAALRNALDRAEERDRRQAEAERQRAVSVHLGEVGERLELTFTVTRTSVVEGDYGLSYLVIGETPEGSVVKTFSSGAFGAAAFYANAYDGRGSTWRVKATVKAHEDWRGTAQTALTRVKGLERLEDEEVAA